jgi:hypothetical protein
MEIEGGGTAGYVTMGILSVPTLIGLLIAIILILTGISMLGKGGVIPGVILVFLGSATALGLYMAGKYILSV